MKTKIRRAIGSLWSHKSRDGRVYLSGTLDLGPILGSLQIVAFPNPKKKKNLQPDYRILIADDNDLEVRQR